MTASMTELPVLGVPVESKALSGLDSLLSIVQMPGGVPVGTWHMLVAQRLLIGTSSKQVVKFLMQRCEIKSCL